MDENNTTPVPNQPPPWHPGPNYGSPPRGGRYGPPGEDRRPSAWPDFWLAVSIAWAIFSGIAWAYTDSAANTCHNALVGALDQNQCTSVTFLHDLAGFSVLAAILGIVFAGLVMYKGRSS